MKILHLKIPLLNKNSQNGFAISLEIISRFMEIIEEKIGDEYIVVASPFDPSISEGDEFYTFDMKKLSKKELMDIIK